MFFAGQSLVQLISLFTGFLLIRWLSVESYAQFSVAFGFQSTVSALADLGFCGSIVALVGNRGMHPEVLGRYIIAAKYYRKLIFAVLLPVTVIVFPLLMLKHGWNWRIQIALLGSILVSVVAQGYLSLSLAPLLIHQKLKRSYGAQATAAASRLAMNSLLHAGAILNSAAASWSATFSTIVSFLLLRRSSSHLVKEPSASDREIRKEMLRYVAPFIPGIIFTAFQGQIMVFLITVFGTTNGIAEVGALGRLGQILVVLASVNGVIVEPYFAKLPSQLLRRRYVQALCLATIAMVVVAVAAFKWPDVLLLALGPKYGHLRREASWSIITWCVSFAATLVWTMNAARRWVFWWSSTLYIIAILTLQLLAIVFFNLATSMHVIMLNLITSVTILFLHLVTGMCGMTRKSGSKVIEQAAVDH